MAHLKEDTRCRGSASSLSFFNQLGASLYDSHSSVSVGIILRPSIGIKIHGCSSPLSKIAQYLHITYPYPPLYFKSSWLLIMSNIIQTYETVMLYYFYYFYDCIVIFWVVLLFLFLFFLSKYFPLPAGWIQKYRTHGYREPITLGISGVKLPSYIIWDLQDTESDSLYAEANM